jgi:hypothetical protein
VKAADVAVQKADVKCKGSVTIADIDEIVAEVDHQKHEPLTDTTKITSLIERR